MSIDYEHAKNPQTHGGPLAAFPVIFADSKPQSLLDVGCGAGAWLNAAIEFGLSDIVGVDGVDIPDEQLLIPPSKFRKLLFKQNLTQPWSLNRRFDAVLCMEVAEHLEEKFAPILIEVLVAHSDLVVFSAACPGQPGQHHVNCQWPSYWQKLFNERGYVCTDDVRWKIWDDERIEPWYRQNIIVARKDASRAGREPRIHSAVIPAIYPMIVAMKLQSFIKQTERGKMPFKWYVKSLCRSAWNKLRGIGAEDKDG